MLIAPFGIFVYLIYAQVSPRYLSAKLATRSEPKTDFKTAPFNITRKLIRRILYLYPIKETNVKIMLEGL